MTPTSSLLEFFTALFHHTTMLGFRTALSNLARAAVPLRTRAATRTLATTPGFLGTYISTPKACVNLRVIHPKYKTSKDANSHVLSSPGVIVFQVAPTDNGKQSWEKKQTFYITPSDIIQILSWVPTQEVRCHGACRTHNRT